MASQIPCVKNGASGYTFYISLVSQASTLVFQANPTLAAGDFKIAIDDGAPNNLGTLPAVDADFTKRVKVVLSQAETNGDNLTIICSDAAGAEWCDLTINIQTAAQTFDATDVVADAVKVQTDKLAFTAANQVDAQVFAQQDIDFGATQKASIQAAVLADRGAANTELASVPTTTSGWGAMVQFLFEYFRNVRTETSAAESLKKEDGTTELGSRTLADDGSVFTRGEMN